MRKRRSLRVLNVMKKLALSCLIIVLGLASWLYYYAVTPIRFIPMNQYFLIEVGQTGKQVVRMLEQKKLVQQPFWYLCLMQVLGSANKIQAGSYEVQSPLSPYQLLAKITEGDVESSSLLIIEGWRWQDVRHALSRDPNLQHKIKEMADGEVLKALGAKEKHLEGIFFPDTYHYAKGSTDLALLRRAYALMQKNLRQAWQARATDLPLTSPYELLILASIVEKETGHAADREYIASVLTNRLRVGMRLQTDPTVIYGMGERYKGYLRKVDLMTDTLYNTYTRAGLPPSPIALPGRAALFAAAQPAKTRALYFVSKGDGSSHFSESLIAHNRAVNVYIRRSNR